MVQAFRPVLVTLPPAAPGTPLFEPMRRTVLPAAFVTTFAAPGVAGPTPFQPEPLLVKVPFSWALAEERTRKDGKRAAPNRRFRAARQGRRLAVRRSHEHLRAQLPPPGAREVRVECHRYGRIPRNSAEHAEIQDGQVGRASTGETIARRMTIKRAARPACGESVVLRALRPLR